MKILLPCLFALICYTTTHAQRLDSVRNYTVDEVVVTSTRSPLQLKHTPVITRVINSVDIRRQSTATLQNLLERELAGVEFHQAGYGSSLSFQGLDARYVLFLIDGERMAGETYGNVDYARVQINNIERIEIVRGASSVLYGSNAMGAVVNIITRMPTKRVEIDGSFRYGTRFEGNNNEMFGAGTVGATDSDLDKYRSKIDLPNTKSDLSLGLNLGKFRSLTSLSYRTVDAYRLSGSKNEVRHYKELTKMGPKMSIPPGGGRPTIEFDPVTGIPVFAAASVVKDTTISVAPDARGLSISGWQGFNLSHQMDYELSEKFRFQLSGGYFLKNRYDFQTSIMDENPMSAMLPKPWTYENYMGYDVKALMEHSPNEDNKIYLSFARNEYMRDLVNLADESTPKQRHTYNNPRLLWTLNTKYNRLTTGLEVINEQLNFDLNPKGFDNRKSLNSATAYVQDEILTGKPLSFVVGLRGEYSDRFGWSVTPKVSAKINMGDFSLRANYSNGYRTPSLKEMYMELDVPVGVSTKILGNDKLREETNNYFSLSGEYTINKLNVSATVYHNRFKNKIDVRGSNVDGVDILKYDNINSSKLSGVEVMAFVRPVNGLSLSLNYNYVNILDDAPAGSTQYIYPSPHTATMIVNYDYSYERYLIGFTASVRYVGAKDYEDFMTVLEDFKTITMGGKPVTMPTKFFTGSYSAHHDGYATVNAALNVEWNKMLTFSFGVDNIFNYTPRVVNFNSALTPCRNAFIQMAFRF